MPDRDELYSKYRVFHEPVDDDFNVDLLGHPVPVEATYPQSMTPDGVWLGEAVLEEVPGLFFVLRPEGDEYARQAIAAYAYACRRTHPHLAADLKPDNQGKRHRWSQRIIWILREMRWLTMSFKC